MQSRSLDRYSRRPDHRHLLLLENYFWSKLLQGDGANHCIVPVPCLTMDRSPNQCFALSPFPSSLDTLQVQMHGRSALHSGGWLNLKFWTTLYVSSATSITLYIFPLKSIFWKKKLFEILKTGLLNASKVELLQNLFSHLVFGVKKVQLSTSSRDPWW